jgi:hypothetical protein
MSNKTSEREQEMQTSNFAVAEGVDSYRQRVASVARMDSAEGAALSPALLDHARGSGSGGGRPATITRGELAALALRQVRACSITISL